MKIEIMSEDSVELFSREPIDSKCVIISIRSRTCHRDNIVENTNILDVLYLQFDDVGVERYSKVAILMDNEHANMIKNFIDYYKDKVDLILVNCEAGISRSSAVAYVIGRYLDIDVEWILTTGCYIPNWHCVRALANTLGFKWQLENIREFISKNNKALDRLDLPEDLIKFI